MRKSLALAVLLSICALGSAQSSREAWRPATEAELKTLIPERAPVVQERIETEMRTASGITDGKGKLIAGVVLITAGYSANGKYSLLHHAGAAQHRRLQSSAGVLSHRMGTW